MSRTVLVSDDVAAALGAEQVARLNGPGVVRTGHTVLFQGSRYLTDWPRRGRAGVKAAVRAGLLVGCIVPVELRGPGNDVTGWVFR